MIKAKGEMNGRQCILLGLSSGNLKRLKAGKPIKVNGTEMGMDTDIVIFWGRTEKSMVRDLQKVGILDPDMPIHEHHDDENVGTA
jgi:hypothetical protein